MNSPNSGVRLLSVVILFLWGAVMLYFYATGRIAHYLPLDGPFRSMVLWGGIGMVVLALFNLATLGTPDADCRHDHGCGDSHGHEGHACGHDHDHDHDHSHGALEQSGPVGRLVSIVVLTVPIALAALLTPDQFSLQALENKGIYATTTTVAENMAASPQLTRNLPIKEPRSMGRFTLADLKRQIPQTPAGDFQMELAEIFYSASDLETSQVLEGQPVETIGRVIEEKVNNAEGRRLRLFRLSVMCCVADARPFSVVAEFGGRAPKFKSLTWVKVRGNLHFQPQNSRLMPILQEAEIQETAPPAEGNLF